MRLDAEYYQPRFIKDAARLAKTAPQPIGSFAVVTDGIHASPDEVEEGGVKYLSAKCVKDNFFVLSDALQISNAQHEANPRTSLREDDVLITTVGTIGNAAVVQPEILPANSDRHLGIIRITDKDDVDPYYLATFLNSEFGRFQSLREATGNVQLNLFIEKIRELAVPRLHCEAQVAKLTRAAYGQRKKAVAAMNAAEALYVNALGLQPVKPHRGIGYTRTMKDLLTERRFDAEYFHPRYQQIIAQLRQSGLTISDVAHLSERVFKPSAHAEPDFSYIEIGSLAGDGEAEHESVPTDEAPSRATWIVEPGDVITSTVRPIRRLSALIRKDQDGCVCSSGFAVLTPKTKAHGIEPEVLLTYLRLPLVCEILNLNTTATMYPAISTDRLLGIPIVLPAKPVRRRIVDKLHEAIEARNESKRLLDKAKKSVEIAIAGAAK